MDKPHTDYRSTGTRGGRNSTQAFIGNVRSCHCDERIALHIDVIQGISRRTDAQWSGGLDRSCDEVSVMGMERRVQLIRLH